MELLHKTKADVSSRQSVAEVSADDPEAVTVVLLDERELPGVASDLFRNLIDEMDEEDEDADIQKRVPVPSPL
ncbi:hypothetical protein MMC22_007544 [Lobaria immixta]|nr:hypothetical protein [Lobaria immixta]